ncbi:MAG TPA: response regulator transcription factor [Symbiobacteriaceae bacterium]|jgi:two-component system alkaline phosphatase synthesis response regulator PhoP
MPERVLVVDQDDAVLELVAGHLRRAGYDVLTAGTGADGLSLVRTRDPHLVIMDVVLPDADGFEVCKQIRKHREVPVLILSARDDEIDRVVGFEIGADDYVTKPFSPRELVGRVKAILRRSAPRKARRNEGQVVCGPLRINFATYEVTRNGQRVDLTAKEFRILGVLAGQSGRVFTRREIADRVMGPDFVGDLQVIDVHIRHLRMKLEADAAQPRLLETVRGVGYKWTG